MSSYSIKKASIKFQLQLTNLDGDSGLGITQSFCCLGEALQLNDFYKRMQLSNFHDVIPPSIIFSIIYPHPAFLWKRMYKSYFRFVQITYKIEI